MSRRGAAVVVLCEDKQHECFFRRLLKLRGYQRVRVVPYPNGRGAGTAHVVAKFPIEARQQRAKATHMTRGLVTAIDADTGTVDQRHKQLLGQLERPRGKDEKIAIFVPKRNIETWIAYLKDGTAVNEDDEYPKLAEARGCYPAADKFLTLRPDTLPDDCPPSLQRAVTEEMPRLP